MIWCNKILFGRLNINALLYMGIVENRHDKKNKKENHN